MRVLCTIVASVFQLQLDKLNLLEGQTVFTQPELERQKMLMWQQLAILVTPSIHSVVEFSKRVPSESGCTADACMPAYLWLLLDSL